MDQSAIDAGTVDGKFYALSIGANSHMAVYNTRLFEEAGVKPGETFDPYAYTYDELKEFAKAIKDATGVAGTDDNTADYQNFSDFTVQKGANLYNEDGSYGPTQEIVEEYWSTWAAIRDAGGTPPGPESAALAGVAELSQQGIVTGKSAMTYVWSNQLVGVQGLVQDALGAAVYPNTPAMVPGSVIQPSQFICLTRDSGNPEAATAYMSAFVNDLEMTKVLGLERGIPSNSDVRAALEPDLSAAEKVSVEFFDKIQGKTAPLTAPPPSGSAEVEQTFERLAVSVLLGERTIPEVATDFLNQAKAILARA
jgi:multiple sugar transport system substrate-binding protein